jgi:aldehyde:ferredoxin oxidoreductase
MHVCRNIYGVVVTKRDLELAGENIGGHRRDLGPNASEFEQPANKLCARWLVGPYARRITPILGCDELDCEMEIPSHLRGIPVQGSWLRKRLEDLPLSQLPQLRHVEGANPKLELMWHDPTALGTHLPRHDAGD